MASLARSKWLGRLNRCNRLSNALDGKWNATYTHTNNISINQYNIIECYKRAFSSSTDKDNNDNDANTINTTESQSTDPPTASSSTKQSRVVRSASTHYGTFNRRSNNKAEFAHSVQPSKPLAAPTQDTAQQLTDVDTVFNNARLVVEEYRKRIDSDDNENTPTSIGDYITKLQRENETTSDHDNSDFVIHDVDMQRTGIGKRQLRGKTLHTERVIGRLKQEEALQERLSLIDEYGRPSLLKRIPNQSIDEYGRAYGFGKRKSSSARVYIKYNQQNAGEIIVNQQRYIKYFQRYKHRAAVVQPLMVSSLLGQFDVVVETHGGGHTGQADAVKLAISKALQNYEPLLREQLKDQFLFTRDARSVERKKFGHYKARKGYTYVRR